MSGYDDVEVGTEIAAAGVPDQPGRPGPLRRRLRRLQPDPLERASRHAVGLPERHRPRHVHHGERDPGGHRLGRRPGRGRRLRRAVHPSGGRARSRTGRRADGVRGGASRARRRHCSRSTSRPPSTARRCWPRPGPWSGSEPRSPRLRRGPRGRPVGRGGRRASRPPARGAACTRHLRAPEPGRRAQPRQPPARPATRPARSEAAAGRAQLHRRGRSADRRRAASSSTSPPTSPSGSWCSG